jgi:hypothetical protein
MAEGKVEFKPPTDESTGAQRLQSPRRSNADDIAEAESDVVPQRHLDNAMVQDHPGNNRLPVLDTDEPMNGQNSAAGDASGDASYFRDYENGVAHHGESLNVEIETYSDVSLLNGANAGAEIQGEPLHPTTNTAAEKREEQSKEKKRSPDDIVALAVEETEPLSPSRYSMVSSFDSTVYGTTEQDADDADDDDDDCVAGVTIDPLLLFGSKYMESSSNILDEINMSNSLMNDEKSIRSESTRPDPPSIVNGQNPIDHNENGGYAIPLDNMDIKMGVQEVIEEYDDRGSNVDDTPGSIPYDFAEDEAAQALAALSKNVAEATLQDDEKQDPDPHGNGSSLHGNGWDLDRNMVLAETPEGETKSMTTLLEKAWLAVPLDPEETLAPPPPTLGYRQVAGPDNLVMLPRVDDHLFYEYAPSTGRSVAQRQQHPLLGPPLRQPHSLTHHDLQMPPPPFDHAQQLGYAQRVVQAGPSSILMGMRGGGRRKIRLRLQEEVLNSSSNIKRHSRSVSLLGTLRKSSTRMLRFTGADRSTGSDIADELKPGPDLYKSLDRGSIVVSWYEGTGSLELQEHVRRCVVRKLKLEKTSVELDDMRILDENTDPPEGKRRTNVRRARA